MFKAINKQVERTRKWIFNALLTLLGKKPYNEIKIANIAEEAGVARQSFYRNFENKDDIIIKYIEDIFSEFVTKATKSETFKITGYSDLYSLFFEIMLKNKNQLIQLKNASLSYLIYKTFIDFGKKINNELFPENITSDKKVFPDYFAKYQIGGFLSLTIEWIENDMTETPEELGMILQRITEEFDSEQNFCPVIMDKLKILNLQGEE